MLMFKGLRFKLKKNVTEEGKECIDLLIKGKNGCIVLTINEDLTLTRNTCLAGQHIKTDEKGRIKLKEH